ncbi:GMC family oxidoreductase [Aureimonas altamirensis]|uniref:GMC family oxidoreductase n=1 Tax=Aureimonas altamirensis TaxID=370622 RepID=UPI0030174B18
MGDDVVSHVWDIIVIGSGVGGGTVGRSLAESGLSVLFLEKGTAGYRREETPLDTIFLDDPEQRLLRGFWPDKITADLSGVRRDFFAPLGAGVGGTSVFYAATLERPEPHDLDEDEAHPHPTGGWPVSFREMLPWFDEAQRLYRVQGSPVPHEAFPAPNVTRPAPPSPGDKAIMTRMEAGGLHPYQLHSAIAEPTNCQNCAGRKCPRPCKMDGRSVGVEPAVATGNATVLERCEVVELKAGTDGVEGVVARHNGRTITLSGRHIVLAAGALSSPRLLLDSVSDAWPDGIGNRHDLVGRNLMFHLNELFALFPKRSEAYAEASKSVGFRDFYFRDGVRYGMVQSMGLNAGYGAIAHHLKLMGDRSVLRGLPGRAKATSAIAAAVAPILGQAKMFVGLLEDLPYHGNRVVRDANRTGRIQIEYGFAPELLERRQSFRQLIRKSVPGLRSIFLTHEPEPNFGHPSGTLRMGRTAADSVVDRECRVHGMPNLWVADASFMPTSMGVNPSLTIAANALRVANSIKESMR